MPKKSKVEELLETLVARIEKLENTINKPITSQSESLKESAPQVESTPAALLDVPFEFRKEVDSILNRDFEVEIEKHLDAPLMTFTVIVPDKYSLITPSQREIMKRDIRPKVITTAGGVNEVREWSEMVFKNLTPEIQAMVVSDRMKA